MYVLPKFDRKVKVTEADREATFVFHRWITAVIKAIEAALNQLQEAIAGVAAAQASADAAQVVATAAAADASDAAADAATAAGIATDALDGVIVVDERTTSARQFLDYR